jgi:hypothetical protein
MTDVPLPALDGRDPLGFLAALGVLNITAQTYPDARLSFSPATGTAILTSPLTTTDAIAAALAEAVARVPDGSVLDGTGPGFPMRKLSPQQARETGASLKDPMRVERTTYRQSVHEPVAAMDRPAALKWLAALITDLGTDNSGRAAVTPFSAPSGQQSLWTFIEKSHTIVRDNPGHLSEALTGWRRVPGFTGEYLDHRVLNSAADHPSGKSTEAGVPGATWLAIQALPLLRLTGDGNRPRATLWHQAGTCQIMIWPLWQPPLNQYAVPVLLEHPFLQPAYQTTASNTPTPMIDLDPLSPLGVFQVCGAQRIAIDGRKTAGVLAPLNVTTE